MFESLRKMFGVREERPAAPGAPVVVLKPILLRVEKVEPLAGSPSGTEAYYLRLSESPEAYVRLQLTIGPSRVSSHFGFAHGSFCREPAGDGAAVRQKLAEAWGVSGEAAQTRVSLRSFEVQDVIPLDEGWRLVARMGGEFHLVVDAEAKLAELQAMSPADARALVQELAEVL